LATANAGEHKKIFKANKMKNVAAGTTHGTNLGVAKVIHANAAN
jgi:hypothetical protein